MGSIDILILHLPFNNGCHSLDVWVYLIWGRAHHLFVYMDQSMVETVVDGNAILMRFNSKQN